MICIAAELSLALMMLHELGVSYNELDLDHVMIDSSGHVILWREFENKEYWSISECICGGLAVRCGKTGHQVKRRGSNSGQLKRDEILQKYDWKSLGSLLVQLLIGRTEIQSQARFVFVRKIP